MATTDDNRDEYSARIEQVVAEIPAEATRAERDAVFKDLLDEMPGDVATPNQPYAAAHTPSGKTLRAEVNRRWEADRGQHPD